MMGFQYIRAAVLAYLAGAAALFFAAGAHATIALPVATISATATTCGPCGGAVGASATNVDNGVSDLLSEFGDDYNITSFDPSLVQNNVSTPGRFTVSVGGNAGAVVATEKGPSVTSSGAGGVASDTGDLDYFFEVAKTTSTSTSPTVSIGVTATGKVSSTTSGTGFGFLNNAQVTAELLITPGSGTTTLEELAQAYYGYYQPPGGSCQCSNMSTANVTGTLGATSDFSGGFSIHDQPITVELNTEYEVELITELTGGSDFNGFASVDPMYTVPVGYELLLSPGITNGSPVPEPSTWAMMAIGFAGLGFLAGRARNRGPAAA